MLSLGNTLNGLSSGSGASGFQLSSLRQLADTRSFDESTTLLQLLVGKLEVSLLQTTGVPNRRRASSKSAAEDVPAG